MLWKLEMLKQRHFYFYYKKIISCLFPFANVCFKFFQGSEVVRDVSPQSLWAQLQNLCPEGWECSAVLIFGEFTITDEKNMLPYNRLAWHRSASSRCKNDRFFSLQVLLHTCTWVGFFWLFKNKKPAWPRELYLYFVIFDICLLQITKNIYKIEWKHKIGTRQT